MSRLRNSEAARLKQLVVASNGSVKKLQQKLDLAEKLLKARRRSVPVLCSALALFCVNFPDLLCALCLRASPPGKLAARSLRSACCLRRACCVRARGRAALGPAGATRSAA